MYLRVAGYWNKLPELKTVANFKIGLELYKKKHFLKLGNYWELADIEYIIVIISSSNY